MNASSSLRLSVSPWLLFLFLVLLACSSKIGDECSQNLDCGAGRFCDTSQPDGYCTLKGCRTGTCPDDAVCIRFYTSESYCVKPCATNAACRTGYSCRLVDGAPSRGCLPQ